MKIKLSTIAISILAVFIGFIVVSDQIGYWKTESQKIPARYQSGALEGEYDPSDIRGSYTFSDVSTHFGIPLDVLGTAFDIPGQYDLASFQNKNLESMYVFEEPYEIGNGSVKLFVALYTNRPYAYASNGDYLPETAVHILELEGKLNNEIREYLSTHTIQLDASHQSEPTVRSNASEHDVESDTVSVKGKTMFQEVLDAGLTEDEIESVLGIDMGHPLEEIRTYCQEHGLEFGLIKSELQSIIDSKR